MTPSDQFETERDSELQSDNHRLRVLTNLVGEMRIPLNSILEFGKTLAADNDNPLSGEHAAAISNILTAAREMGALIDNVLQPGPAASKILNSDDQTVDMGQVVEKCVHLIEPLAERSRVDLSNGLAGGQALRVIGDEPRLRQTIFNLLSNAVKFSRAGGTVTIGGHILDDGWVRIEISDTGIGIPQARWNEIFDPLAAGVGGGGESLGMGLAIAKRLTELMGGRIGFDSEPDRGSTFWIDLPSPDTEPAAARVEVVPSPEEKQPEQAAPPSLQEGACYSLLYVEDNPANVRLLEYIIAREKRIKLTSAVTAEEGIEIAKADLPDLILMDIGLPGMDGYQALEVLKSDPDTRQIPVMAVSATAMRHDVERGKSAGFADYLTKPLVIDDFLSSISQILPLKQGE